MKKMAYREEMKLADNIDHIMSAVEKGSNPTDTVVKWASDTDASSEAVSRVCETINKLMAITHIAGNTGIKRASAFELIDVDKVQKHLKASKQAADVEFSLPNTAMTDIPLMDYSREAIKRANDDIEKPDQNDVPTDAEKGLNYEEANEAVDKVCHAQEQCKHAEMDADDKYHNMSAEVEGLGNQDLTDLAKYVQANYGEKGEQLIDMLYQVAHQDKPVNIKEASGKIVLSTGTPAHKAVDAFMLASCRYLIRKEGADMAVKVATSMASILGTLKEGLTAAAENNPSDTLPAPLSVEGAKRINKLSTTDNFANIYLGDEFLNKYPPETVLTAYNNIIQAVPSLAKRPNSEALVKSLVKRMVTTNNQFDPLELKGLADLDKTLTDTNLKAAQYDNELYTK